MGSVYLSSDNAMTTENQGLLQSSGRFFPVQSFVVITFPYLFFSVFSIKSPHPEVQPPEKSQS